MAGKTVRRRQGGARRARKTNQWEAGHQDRQNKRRPRRTGRRRPRRKGQTRHPAAISPSRQKRSRARTQKHGDRTTPEAKEETQRDKKPAREETTAASASQRSQPNHRQPPPIRKKKYIYTMYSDEAHAEANERIVCHDKAGRGQIRG